MKKRLITVLLSIFIAMTAFTTNVFAATTVSTWDDLKNAINASTTSEVITLGGDITVADTYTIASGKDITIELNGHTINGNSNQIFILSGKLKIQDTVGEGTITGGENSTGSGGAVAIKGTGELTLESGTFTGNSAKYGGAISIDENGGKFIMNGGKISGNTSTSNGAGIYANVSGTYIEMSGGEISGNNSNAIGGGIYMNQTEMKLYGGKIIYNTAGAGAGIGIGSHTASKLYLGGNSVVKDNTNSSGDLGNIYPTNNSSALYISTDKPLTSGAELYVTVYFNNEGDWGSGKDVGQYFNDTMTDSNYQYFYFTNFGNVEKNTVYSVTKRGSNYETATPPVCKIGSTGYPTLDDALAAVNSGQTITMLEDVSYTNGTGFDIDGKTVKIDFDGHIMTVNASSMPTVTKLFTVSNSGNLTINNGKIVLTGMGLFSWPISSFTVSGSGSKLALNNVTQESNLDKFLTVDGGTATINGGTFGTNNNTTKINLTNNASLTLTNNPTFYQQGSLIIVGESSNTDPDTLTANVTIDSGTFNSTNTICIIDLYAKANVTINGGTFTSSNGNSAPIYIRDSGYKSNLTINNLTSDSPYVFWSGNNSNIGSFTATVNNGHFKYTKGQFAKDVGNNLSPNIKLNGGYYGPNTADDDALAELTAFLGSGKNIEVLGTGSEYSNGYRYKVYGTTPSPSSDPSSGHVIPNTGIE